MSDKESNREAANKKAKLKRLSSSHWVLETEHEEAARKVAELLGPYKARAINAKNKCKKPK